MFKVFLEKALEQVRRIPFFKDSNRDKHFLFAIPFGMVFTLLFVLGLALGMEYKDRLKGGKFDMKDLLATIYGGLIGQAIQLIVLFSFFK